MNLQDLMVKLKKIDENQEIAPTKDDKPSEAEGIISIGGPVPGMMGHAEPPPQQDSVSMNVSLNGAGAGGVRDLMDILHNIEKGVSGNKDDDTAEPIMGAAHDAMSHDGDLDEVIDDDNESWGNSASGSSGHHTHGIEAVTFSGDDMNSKGKISPVARAPGTNSLREPSQFDESLVDRLQAMYQEIKEDAGGPQAAIGTASGPINPNAKCNICHTPYAKHFRFDPPGDPTGKRTSTLIRGMCGAVPQNFPDLYSMSESDKKTMSRAAKRQ